MLVIIPANIFIAIVNLGHKPAQNLTPTSFGSEATQIENMTRKFVLLSRSNWVGATTRDIESQQEKGKRKDRVERAAAVC